MKIRTDFVTNSSSSSFVIRKRHLSQDQIDAIWDHFDVAIQAGLEDKDNSWSYPWHIQENDEFIAGSVDMDNFSMSQLLEWIKVPDGVIHWGEFPFDIDDPDEDIPEDEHPYQASFDRGVLKQSRYDYDYDDDDEDDENDEDYS